MESSCDQYDENQESSGAYYNCGDDEGMAFNLLLNDVQSLGRFATGLRTKPAIGPRLYVADIGHVSLPLGAEFNKKLRATCQLTKQQSDRDPARPVWQLEPVRLAATNPGWEAYVKKLSQFSCTSLGVSEAVELSSQLRLRKVILVHDGHQYESSLDSNTAPGTFASMVISPCLPSMETRTSVHYEGRVERFDFKATDNEHLACVTFYAGCTYALHPGKSGCCLAMVYDLIQHTNLPAAVKNLSWFRTQMDWRLASGDFIEGNQRCFYILDRRYDNPSVAGRLHVEHHRIAHILRTAEEQGLLEVYVTWIPHAHIYDAAQDERSYVTAQDIADASRVDTILWSELTGPELGWTHAEITYSDIILQEDAHAEPADWDERDGEQRNPGVSLNRQQKYASDSLQL